MFNIITFLSIKISASIKKGLLTIMVVFFSIFSTSYCYSLNVGDSYGGGTVFCVSQTEDLTQCKTEGSESGDYGLVMANEDQVNYDSNSQHGVTWSSEYKEIGIGAQSLYNGVSNTKAIINAHPKDNSNNNAAWLSNNYKDPIEGHTDWYLPSKKELDRMLLFAKAHNLIGKGCSGDKFNGVVRCLIGGGNDRDKAYWSSTEFCAKGNNNAWYQTFSDGNNYICRKVINYLGIRAIRVFNNSEIQQFHRLIITDILNDNRLTQVFSDIIKNYPNIKKLNNASIDFLFQEIKNTFNKLL